MIERARSALRDDLAYVEELEYPTRDWTAVITICGRICYQRRKINVSQVFGGQRVGVKQVDEHMWLITFMRHDLGYFDDQTCRLEPIDKSLRPKTVTYVSGIICHPCTRNRPANEWLAALDEFDPG